MTDDLDPKLQELEAKLRRLKPLAVGCRPPGGNVGDSRLRCRVPHTTARRSVAYLRTAYILGATAATILVLVWLLPQNPPQPLPPIVEPMIVANELPSALCRLPSNTMPSPTMRQQLAELLDEMNVAELPTVKPEYPVVEIVVQTESVSRYTGTENGRPQQRFERTRWRYDEEMLMMF